jgi:ribosomal-protein-alanine N-acetyltransferase
MLIGGAVAGAPGAGLVPARVTDAADLAALHAAAFPADQAWGVDGMRLMLEMAGAFGLWRPAAGLVLARVAADEAEIITLAVLPAARRGGLGRALLEAALAVSAARGAAWMFLEVAPANTPARGLYAAAGFAEVGRRRRYYSDGGDALVLRRDLP